MKKGKKFKISLALALTVILAGSVFYGWHNSITSRATFDPSSCIKFKNYADASSLPSSTIWVGTYLISLNKATDSIYEKAKESAKNSGQGDTYYKSELSDGSWYKVTSAQYLSEIQPNGTPVSESELKNLYVKFYIDQKGVVHDLATGEDGASIYNDPNPYGKWYMDEYEPMASLINDSYLSSTDKDAILKFYYDIVFEHLNYDNTDDYTKNCDSQLSNVEKIRALFEASSEEGDADYAEGLSAICDSVDADRKCHYIENILSDDGLGGMTELLEEAKYPWDYSSAKAVDDKCETAIETSKGNLKTSYDDYKAKIISDPGESGGILERERYKCYETILAYDASSGLNSTIREAVKKFVCIQNIEDENVVNKEDELALVAEYLPKAISEYKENLGAGVCAQYRTAYSQDSATSGLVEILDNQAADTNTLQMQVRKLIEADKLRIEDDEAALLLSNKLEEAQGMYSVIVSDVYKSYASADLTSYIKYLSEELDSLAASEADTSTETSSLEEQLTNYESQKEEAEKKNDLATAADLEVMIKNIEEQIEEIKAALADSSTGTDTETTTVVVESAKTAKKNLRNTLKRNAISDLASGNTDSAALAVLFAMGDEDDLVDILEDDDLDSDTVLKAMMKASKKLNNATEGVDGAVAISTASSSGSGSSTDGYDTKVLGADSNADSSDSSKNTTSGSGTGGSTESSGTGSDSSDENSGSDSGTSGNSDSTGSGSGSGNGSSNDTSATGSKNGTGSTSGDKGNTGTGTDASGTNSGTTGASSSGTDQNSSTGENTSETEGLGDTSLSGEAAELLKDVLEEATSDEDQEALDEMCEELGVDSDEMSANDEAAILAAAADGDITLSSALTNRLLADLMSAGIVYDTYIDDDIFVSLKAVESVASFRYVFNKEMTKASMQMKNSGTAYSFEDGSDKVTISSKEKTMKRAAKFTYSWLYVDNDTAATYFGVTGLPITGTNYSLVLNEEMRSEIEALTTE